MNRMWIAADASFRAAVELLNDIQWLDESSLRTGTLLPARVAEVAKQRKIERVARAEILDAPDPPGPNFPRRRAYAESFARSFTVMEGLEQVIAALSAKTNSQVQLHLDSAKRQLSIARYERWQHRLRFHRPGDSSSARGWGGLWEQEGEIYTGLRDYNPYIPFHVYRDSVIYRLVDTTVRDDLRRAVFVERRPRRATVEALQLEVDAVSAKLDHAAGLLAALQREFDSVKAVAGREERLTSARYWLTGARRYFNSASKTLSFARRDVERARRAPPGEADFERTRAGVLRETGVLFHVEATETELGWLVFCLRRIPGMLDDARGIPAHPPAPPLFAGAWIGTQTRAEHAKEIAVVARELRDARVYAETRALIAGRLPPAATSTAFTAADQHVAAARRELAGFFVAADAKILVFFADRVQRELGEARADVAAGLAALDREVEPNALALELRLRDATAAVDAAAAQLARGETHLAANLALPTGVTYAAALRGLEAEWQQIDQHGATPHRLVRRYDREEQVAVHRAHNRLARARREYLAAARAHLAKIRTALAGSPTLTPALLTTLTGDFVAAEADRRALREEILGARQLEDRIVRRIRVARTAAAARRPATEPAPGTVAAERRTWATRLAALGNDLVAAELALEAELVAKPPALQPAGDAATARSARLGAAANNLALARRELHERARFGLMFSFVVESGRWPLGLGEGFWRAHGGLRDAQADLVRAKGVTQAALVVWRDRSAADHGVAATEGVALTEELDRLRREGKTVPAGADAARQEGALLIVARLGRQQSARNALNKAIADGTALAAAERERLLGEFLFAGALDVMLPPVARGFRALDAAARTARAPQPSPGPQPSPQRPQVPTGLTATRGTSDTHVDVSWTVRSGETYDVFRCMTAAAASCGDALASGLGRSPYRDATAPAGQTFHYRVRAKRGELESGLSAGAPGERRAADRDVASTMMTTTGDGTNAARGVGDIAVDGRGRVFAVAGDSDSVFRMDPDGTTTRILSSAGDGTHSLDRPTAVAATPGGDALVAGGDSDNVFRVEADGDVTRVMSSTGDGTHALDFPADVAVEADGDVVVAGRDSDNVFRVTGEGTVTRIVSSTGDGTNALDAPVAVAATPGGDVYVAGRDSNNVFRVATDGTVTQVASSRGDGTNALRGPSGLAVEASGDVLVAAGDTAFRVTPTGTVTTVYRGTATGTPRMVGLRDVAAGGDGQIFVSGHGSDNVLAIAPDGTVQEVLSATGDATTAMDGPAGLAADAAGNVYVAGQLSGNAFRVSTRLHKVLASTDSGSFPVRRPVALAVAEDGRLYVADRDRGRLYTVTEGDVLEGSFPLAAASPSRVSVPRPGALALDGGQNFYVAGQASDSAVRGAAWAPTALRELVTAVGDGRRRLLDPTAVLVGSSQTVYVAGGRSDNVLRVTAAGALSQLIDRSGDGTHRLDHPSALARHRDGTLYVAGRDSDNVFRVTGEGVVSRVLGRAGAGGHALDGPAALALNAAGDLFVASAENDNVFRVPATGAATRVVSATGDGVNALDRPVALSVDAEGVLYVAGGDSHNVFAVSPQGAVSQLIGPSGDGTTRFHAPLALVARGRGELAVATAGRRGANAIPAAVFRLDARPAVPPPAPAPAPEPPTPSPAPAPQPSPNPQ